MTTTEPNPTSGLQPVGNGSLTGRTTNALLDAILNRRFPDNRLPPEPELAEQLAVSRTTIRAALQSLERLGVLSRAPGRGTMVRTHIGRESIVLQRLIGFRGLLMERHDDVRVDQRYWVRGHADEVAVNTLKIPADTAVIVSAKTFFADGHPAIHISDQIPLHYCSPSLQEQFVTGDDVPVQDSIFEFSRSWPGREIDHTVVELIPAVAPVESTTLQLEDGTPFMRLLETHYNLASEPVALSEVHVDDRYVRFNVVRHD
jgi:GntR family transcriptional regulator